MASVSATILPELPANTPSETPTSVTTAIWEPPADPTTPAISDPTTSPLSDPTTPTISDPATPAPSNQSTPVLSPAIPAAPAGQALFSKLITRNGTLGLHYSPNANIYAVPPQKVEDPNDISSLFTSDPSGDFIVGDSHGRYLHGYKTEINSFGVGRLRLHTADAMPKTASLL